MSIDALASDVHTHGRGPLHFRAFHGAGGPDTAERLRLSAPAGGGDLTTGELTHLLCAHFGLEDDAALEPAPTRDSREAPPPRRDRARTWLLRNVTKGRFLDAEHPEIEEDDLLEVMDRSVAGR
jgi:hypothetical protein